MLQRSQIVTLVIIGIISAVVIILLYTLSQPKVIINPISEPAELVNPIEISTDRPYYEGGDPATIMTIVHVSEEWYKEGEKLRLEILDGNRTSYGVKTFNHSQAGGIVYYPIHLGGEAAVAGEYWVIATYRGIESQDSFQYEGFKPSSRVKCQPHTLCTYQLMIGDMTYPINFRMNGTIENMIAGFETVSLSIEITAQGPGSLQIAIPIEVLDREDEFLAFVNEENVAIDEIPAQAREWAKVMGIGENPEEYRILIIPINNGSNEVEILGDYYPT